MAILILRDIPKHRVQLNFIRYSIEGGFRGFQNLPPGFHLIQVYEDDQAVPLCAEVILSQPTSVAVFIAEDGKLQVDQSEDGIEFAQMAASGTMNQALIDPNIGHEAEMKYWKNVTNLLAQPVETLPKSTSGSEQTGARFEQFWLENASDPQKALYTMQRALIQVICYQEDASKLRRLFQIHYHAGENGIMLAPAYFPLFVSWLCSVVLWMPSLWKAGTAIKESANYLSEDLHDVGQQEKLAPLLKAATQLTQLLKK